MENNGAKRLKKRTAIPYALLAGALALTLFLVFKVTSLQGELQTADTDLSKTNVKLEQYHQLLSIDSMLLEGKYTTALRSYNETLDGAKENNMSIPLRIAIAKKLSNYESAYISQKKLLEEQEADSLNESQAVSEQEIRQFDAVSFQLEKTKAQLARTRNQLKEKSFGEYLTFKSRKGSQMHYVGTVKNGKANGYGFALLDTGSRYQGDWKDNLRHGEGTFYWPDGEYYVGSYLNDKRNGKGTYHWPNGEKYIGEWKADKRNGQGVFYGEDGEIMTSGIWKNDKLVEEDKESKK